MVNASPGSGALIELAGIDFRYTPDRPVLDGLDFKLHTGERIGLVAPNGSGKTTLLHLMVGFLKPTSGSIRLFGQAVSSERDFAPLRPRIGLLFQDADDQLFSPTVIEDVAFGPLNQGLSKAEAVARAEHTLETLALGEYRDRVTFRLSGGEKRLVALATVLAMQPKVLLLDEPTTGLDTKTHQRVVEILARLDVSYVLISHHIRTLEQLTEKIYSLRDGKIIVDDSLQIHPHYHIHAHGTLPHDHE